MLRSLLVDQAAQLLGVSRRTVYYRIREGQLRTIRTQCGSQRVLLESIEAMLRKEVESRATRSRSRKATRSGPCGATPSAPCRATLSGSPVTTPGAGASSTGPCVKFPES